MRRVFIHCVKTTEQILDNNQNIIFDTIYSQKGECDLENSNLLVWSTGYYHLYFNVYNHIEPCQFSIFKNNAIVDGCIVGSLNYQNSINVVVKIEEDDINYHETLLSSTGFSALIQIKFQSPNLESTCPIKAVITLHKLSDIPIYL